MARSTATVEQVLQIFHDDPTLPPKKIAELLGVSRQRVYQVLKASGQQLPAIQYTPREYGRRRTPKPRVITGIACGPVNCTIAGTVSELLVAADLLARGWQVFLPLVKTSKLDLLATSRDGKSVLRFEVRSGVRHGNRVTFAKKVISEHDYYGIVVAGEAVTYEPDLPES